MRLILIPLWPEPAQRAANCRWINVFNFYELSLGATRVFFFRHCLRCVYATYLILAFMIMREHAFAFSCLPARKNVSSCQLTPIHTLQHTQTPTHTRTPSLICTFYHPQVLSEETSGGRLKFKTIKSEETKSILLIYDADLLHSGKYSCYPSNTEIASIRVHVLQGE